MSSVLRLSLLCSQVNEDMKEFRRGVGMGNSLVKTQLKDVKGFLTTTIKYIRRFFK